mmetsp:Transcript_19340/g.54105  ORF Transcript_19340/g.54105 Transcript_19340/m.54105 type:complete len:142 (+) Transcript_19340:656-1081(+)
MVSTSFSHLHSPHSIPLALPAFPHEHQPQPFQSSAHVAAKRRKRRPFQQQSTSSSRSQQSAQSAQASAKPALSSSTPCGPAPQCPTVHGAGSHGHTTKQQHGHDSYKDSGASTNASTGQCKARGASATTGQHQQVAGGRNS